VFVFVLVYVYVYVCSFLYVFVCAYVYVFVFVLVYEFVLVCVCVNVLWHTDILGIVQNPPNSKFLCTKTFTVVIWGHFETIPTTKSQKLRISIFLKTWHQASLLSPLQQNCKLAREISKGIYFSLIFLYLARDQ